MLTKGMEGGELFCLRPQYTLSRFQADLTRRSFSGVGSAVLEQEMGVEVDEAGRVWLPDPITPPRLMDAFVENPGLFVRAGVRLTSAYEHARRTLEEIHPSLGHENREMASLVSLADAYVRLLKFTVIGGLLIDEAYARLASLIRSVAPQRLGEHHLDSLLRSDAVRTAVEDGFAEDKRGTKRIEDVDASPMIIFGRISFLRMTATEDQFDRYLGSRLDCVPAYLALRVIVPQIYQFAESWRYADYSMRTHFKAILGSLESETSPYDLTLDEILLAHGGSASPG